MRLYDIVESRAGRDKGLAFMVVDMDDEYAYLVDGKLRKLAKPKRKKLRHIGGVVGVSPRLAEKLAKGETVFDREMRRGISKACTSSGFKV